MSLSELLFGRPLRSEDEQAEQIGVWSGVPVLGLDALASASYGPEAALTVLLPLGALAPAHIGAIILCIGIYFATVPAYFCWVHLQKQLYRLYLSRGGEPVPVSPKRTATSEPTS